MRNVSEVMEELKAIPYIDEKIYSPHTGLFNFADVHLGMKISGISGQWNEKKGSQLGTIIREHNPEGIHSELSGELIDINENCNGKFVEASEYLCTVRHKLTKKEVIDRVVMESLYTFSAPERAHYFFSPDLEKKIKVLGCRTVIVSDQMEIFIISRMKREVPLKYTGPTGIIYEVCFEHTKNVDKGEPLIVVCPQERKEEIDNILLQVQLEWNDSQ